MTISGSSTVDRGFTLVAIFAALTCGGYSFFAPDPGRASGGPLRLSPDEAEYVALAESLATRGELRLPTGDVAKRMPVYPALLSLIYRTQSPDHWQNAMMVIQACIAWCNVMLIALISTRLVDARAGYIAGVISALYAPFLYLESLFLTETLLNFLVLSAVLIHVVFANRLEGRHQVLARIGVSLILGVATLTRANAIVFLIPFAIHSFFAPPQRRLRWAGMIAMMLPAMLVIAPWLARNHAMLGRATLSSIGGLNLYLGHHAGYALNPGLDQADYARFDRMRTETGRSEMQVDQDLHAEAWRFIREQPMQTLINALVKVRVWFTPTIASFGPVLPLLLAAICAYAAWSMRDPTSSPSLHRLRWIATAAFVAAAISEASHLLSNSARKIPLISPGHVLILGVPALVCMRARNGMRGLFLGLVGVQLLVAIAYIPLSRLRWSIDAFFIIAISMAFVRICDLLSRGTADVPAHGTSARSA